MRYIITAGHQVINGKGTGAVSQFGDEAVQALRIREELTKELRRRGINVLNEPPADPLTKVITWIRSLVQSEKDMVIDIHFNSAANDNANGTEVIIPEKHTESELKLAVEMAKAVSVTLGTQLRRGKLIYNGVKTERETAHKSIGILNKPYQARNILVEVCFVSNYEDMMKYGMGFPYLIQAMANVIINHASK